MLSLFSKPKDLTADEVAAARAYIKNYWQKLTITQTKDEDSLVGLPNPYLVPATEETHEFEFREMYYWDTYFMIQGMLDAEHKDFVLGMLDNLTYMLGQYGVIPNASRTYLMGRSQPPLLTSLIWDIYEAYNMDKKWLGKQIDLALDEYHTVWMGKTKPHHRLVYRGLSRYYDINVLHDIAETESGWDMTPRFGRKCLNYLPVDLNSLLYKYETDFAKYFRLTGNKREAARWEHAASHRADTMDRLMWSDLRDVYYDYNYVKERRGTVMSLATMYPLWAGLVTKERAKQLVRTLKRFDNRGGLAATDLQQMNIKIPGTTPTQWAYPNGWAPLHFLVVQGLERYGFHKEARVVAMKWLKTCLDWYNKNGVFLEKYNVVNPGKPPARGVYPSPSGFGWTNAVFERFCRDYIDAK